MKTFVKRDLHLFIKTIDDYNDKRFIDSNKRHCFAGIYNENKTKIKDVLTGKVYEVEQSGKVYIGGNEFEETPFNSKSIYDQVWNNNVRKVMFGFRDDILGLYCDEFYVVVDGEKSAKLDTDLLEKTLSHINTAIDSNICKETKNEDTFNL